MVDPGFEVTGAAECEAVNPRRRSLRLSLHA
jgi:hypothetical protein